MSIQIHREQLVGFLPLGLILNLMSFLRMLPRNKLEFEIVIGIHVSNQFFRRWRRPTNWVTTEIRLDWVEARSHIPHPPVTFVIRLCEHACCMVIAVSAGAMQGWMELPDLLGSLPLTRPGHPINSAAAATIGRP
ncbi:hypothetical protein Bca52824_017975 [Brassica carinata]|uniref:Uncharacterized protein n=1 Tax=Brassica carinata TaxID=52824 RepID=A0A8X7VN20_BRACI|nr:hypothetical protein Bca52824_017975 [Brassica carinata]